MINTINNAMLNFSYEKSNLPINYIVNFFHQYKTDIFHFEEEPENSYKNESGISPPFYFSKNDGKDEYIALFFIYDVSEKDSFDYILEKIKNIYTKGSYSKITKFIISTKNDLDPKLKQVTPEYVKNEIKPFDIQFYEFSRGDSKLINDIINIAYENSKDFIRKNEYFHKIEQGISCFIEKEKLMPNYYEICILGGKDSGKDCFKNKFLYDCCEKNIDLYDFCIARTINLSGKEIKYDINIIKEPNDQGQNQDFCSEFYYKTFNNLDPNSICIIITYDISNKASINKLKNIAQELLDTPDRYKRVVSILGMKCDLLEENELNDKIKEGRCVAELLDAHFYLVSNRTGYNVDRAFQDILVRAYNKYHQSELIPTNNYYKESKISEKESIYSEIHIRNEKPKMKEKDKKKIEKQIEKELNTFKKMRIQKEQSITNKKRKDGETSALQMKETLKFNFPKIFRCIKCWDIPKLKINDLNNTIETKCIHKGKNVIQSYKINEFCEVKSSITENSLCYFCKGNNSNHPHSLDYCYNCQKIFCKKCESNHNNTLECKNVRDLDMKNNTKTIVPVYLVHSYCHIHDTPSKYYCMDCKKYVCETCFEKDHRRHVFKYYKKEHIESLIKEKKQLLEKDKACYKSFQAMFNDCIKSMQKKFDELLDLKMQKLNIKENLIKDLELYKNNYNLIESVANLNFDYSNYEMFSCSDSWKNKLNKIFNFLNEPLYIKNKNICIKENVGRPFNILNEIKRQSKQLKMKENEEKKKEEQKQAQNEGQKEIPKNEEQNNAQKSDQTADQKDAESFSSGQALIYEDRSISLLSDCSIEGNSDAILITDICALSSKYFGK